MTRPHARFSACFEAGKQENKYMDQHKPNIYMLADPKQQAEPPFADWFMELVQCEKSAPVPRNLHHQDSLVGLTHGWYKDGRPHISGGDARHTKLTEPLTLLEREAHANERLGHPTDSRWSCGASDREHTAHWTAQVCPQSSVLSSVHPAQEGT